MHLEPPRVGTTVVLALGMIAAAAAASAQTAGANVRYSVKQTGDVVQLRDSRADMSVSVLTPANSAYEIVVKGQHILRRTFASLDALRANPGLNGVPLLWPYANRLDEQAFYANGTKYSFDTGLGNTGRGAIPIHGFLTNAKEWRVVEAKADRTGAWVTSRLEFYRNPRYMKQFPFAHVLVMTYRLADGALEVRTRIENLSTDPMPVAIGFHPYFQLTDAPRDEWTLSVAAQTHWPLNQNTIPTGETEPITRILPDPKHVRLVDVSLDDVFSDLERDDRGRSTSTLKGKSQQIDLVLGPLYKTLLVFTRTGGGRGRAGATPPPQAAADAAAPQPPPSPGSVALEPMAGISNSMNLAEKGLYKELQSIPAGGTWQESFWIKPSGF